MLYFTYILYSPKYDRYYIGQTNDPELRLKQHNDEKFSWTRAYKPWIIVYKKGYKTRSLAIKEEKYLKSLKNKERIKQFIAGWRSSILRGP